MSSKSQKANKLSLGPLRLPLEITRAQPTLRLFMAYLAQPATLTALEEVASKPPMGSRAIAKRITATADELNRRVGIPHSRGDLRKLVTHAPELRAVWLWIGGGGIGRHTFPEDAVPTKEVIEACLDTYHKWVADLSRAK